MNAPQPDKADAKLWRLLHAIAGGDEVHASRLLATDANLASRSIAVGASRESAFPYFLDACAHHVYAGDTALHIAAAAYRTGIAKQLIGYGAEVSAQNRRGAQPVHYAAVGSPGSARWAPGAQADVVTYLLHAGADANATDKIGATPLHRAVRTRCATVVRVLLANGVDPNLRNGSGSTPLHLAVQNTGRGGSGTVAAREQQKEIIRLLLDHGARAGERDGRGKTVIECIAGQGISELIQSMT